MFSWPHVSTQCGRAHLPQRSPHLAKGSLWTLPSLNVFTQLQVCPLAKQYKRRARAQCWSLGKQQTLWRIWERKIDQHRDRDRWLDREIVVQTGYKHVWSRKRRAGEQIIHYGLKTGLYLKRGGFGPSVVSFSRQMGLDYCKCIWIRYNWFVNTLITKMIFGTWLIVGFQISSAVKTKGI